MTLIEHENASVRRAAISDLASEHTWNTILDARPDYSSLVAMNKHLPTSIVDRLIAAGCSRTKTFIAMKRSLSHQQFFKLSIDDDESIRAMIANNKKTPISILERLLLDTSEIVSEAARNQIRHRQT